MSAASERELRDLLPGYVCGDLSAEERALIERRTVEDPELGRELRRWEELAGRLAADATVPLEPSAEARRAILERVAREAGAAARPAPAPAPDLARERAAGAPAVERREESRRPAFAAWALAASIAALLLASAALWRQAAGRVELDSLRAERDRLEQRVATLQAELDGASRRLEQLAADVRAVTFPGRQPIVLAGLEAAPQASGATFYHPAAREAIFHAYGLPGLEANRIYQLWYILDSGPVSAGIFGVDQRGEATLAVAGLPAPDRIAAWAVTIEPAGGVERPTGPMVVASG
jgi:anti-sigma-K factor RskA